MDEGEYGLQVELPDGTTVAFTAPRTAMSPEAMATHLRVMVDTASRASAHYWLGQQHMGLTQGDTGE